MVKIHKFKTKKEKQPYIIISTKTADAFTASLSELYNKINPNNEILEEGDDYVEIQTPWGYFEYKGTIWPIYADDSGQCDYIFINGKTYYSSSFNPNPEQDFVAMIDVIYKENDNEGRKESN